ncbi:MAG TPA: YfcE family phosphodiesterase [Verrucomicrobiales bacterium]|nr:YfcE family phosphodiesterase [Verrucomicrobiales bacterium]
MKIGVISDTHGFLDPKVPRLFAGVDHILHGGDVGHGSILTSLENIAPVTAVLGNTDSGLDLRETEVLTLGERVFLVHHIVEMLHPPAEWKRRLERVNPAVVIFGHTHKPLESVVGSTLFLNPGYAGRQRFDLPRSVALLHAAPSELRVEFLRL